MLALASPFTILDRSGLDSINDTILLWTINFKKSITVRFLLSSSDFAKLAHSHPPSYRISTQGSPYCPNNRLFRNQPCDACDTATLFLPHDSSIRESHKP